MDKIIKTEKESFNVDMGKLNFNILLVGMQNCAVTLENNLVVSYKIKHTLNM